MCHKRVSYAEINDDKRDADYFRLFIFLTVMPKNLAIRSFLCYDIADNSGSMMHTQMKRTEYAEVL